MTKLRIGVVPYMNAKPLIYGLENGLGKIDLVYEVPAKLPEMLESNELDVTLIPSVNYYRGMDYKIIPGSSISSNGPVESVKLFIRVSSIDKIKVVALDKDSLTSHVLTKIILWKRYSLKPDFITLDDKRKVYGDFADAFLIIGDDALKLQEKGFIVLDLGLEWKKLTGLPFVYAVWVTKSKTGLSGFDKLLESAKGNGLRSLDKIASLESERLKLKQGLCLKYLKESIQYNLDELEIKGLETFYNYALEMGEVLEGKKIEFYSE